MAASSCYGSAMRMVIAILLTPWMLAGCQLLGLPIGVLAGW